MADTATTAAASSGIDWGGFVNGLLDSGTKIAADAYKAKNTDVAAPAAPATSAPYTAPATTVVSAMPDGTKELVIMGVAGLAAVMVLVVFIKRG